MRRLKKWQGLSLRVRRSGLRLLVAEDGEDNRLLLQHYLQGKSFAVQFAPDAQEAVNLVVGGGEFDLILMDLDMPVLDGYAATRQIRGMAILAGCSTHARLFWHCRRTPFKSWCALV